jgi:YVTN family beta-propeller protein
MTEPTRWGRRQLLAGAAAAVIAIALGGLIAFLATRPHRSHAATGASVTTNSPANIGNSSYPGMPPVVDPRNIYSEAQPGKIAAAHRADPFRVYVPNGRSNTLTEIDAATRSEIATYPTAAEPQHVVPAYDLSTLWLLDNQGNVVVPINPADGSLGKPLPVDDPYNLYFTPDGASAIVVAEAHKRLDFRDPHTMVLTGSMSIPDCAGMNHADYNANGGYLLLTCEYAGKLEKIDIAHRAVLGSLDLAALRLPSEPAPMPMAMPDGASSSSMPQDVRAIGDGRHFYVADMLEGGVFVVDGDTLTATRFIPTGTGAHGLTPTRDGTTVYVANRGSREITGPPHGPGSVSVIDAATNAVTATWSVPNGGSPDMGNLTADGTELWLSGRFDSEVYVFDTVAGRLAARIAVGSGPHGLCVWPQPGRYSLGHTGNMR